VTTDARVLARPSPVARIVGLGSIYGKTVRDSRRAAILVGGVAALFVIATGVPYATPDFATVQLRQAFIASLTALPPALRGLLGEPINLDTLGGFVSWRVGNFLPVMLGLWPVLALSGTLAGEAAKGSLDLLASTPHPRRSIALEKLTGHMTAVAFAMAILALAIFGLGQAFARLPGDEISLSAAIGQAVLYGVMMLTAGGAAFAAAPFLGRTRGLGVGLIVLFASYLIYGYSTLSPIIEALKPLSFFVWTAGHRPIAGVTAWPSVGALAAVDLVLFAIGIVAFTRRDLGASGNVGWLRPPSLPAGISGPFSRQLADRFGIALAWGVGIGAYGILIVASADAFGKMISSLPQLTAVIEAVYPGLDLTQPSALLQLTFFSFGSFILGLAGASFLAGWAGDEGRRRLEVVLSTPRSRASWAVRSGLGVLAAIAVVTVVIAVLIGVAIGSQGGDVATPVIGVGILGLAASAFASAGLAAGGLFRLSWAAGVTAFLVIATLLIDTLGAALKLPEVILDLSLYKHLGQPIAGIFDPVGIVVAVAMVVGGVAVCTFGLTRRDIGR